MRKIPISVHPTLLTRVRTCALLAALCLPLPALADTPVDVALLDAMRWEHLERTRPFYLPSATWAEQCTLFQTQAWVATCRERQAAIFQGERALEVLIRDKATSAERLAGAVVIGIPVSEPQFQVYLPENDTEEEDLAAETRAESWLTPVANMASGNPHADTYRCRQPSDCAVTILFDAMGHLTDIKLGLRSQ